MSNEYIVESTDDIVISGYSHRQSVASHYHQFIELVFITEGICDHYYLGHKATMKSGDVFIVVPGEEHAYDVHSKTTILNCLFYGDFLKNEWKDLQEISGIYNFVVLEPFFRFEENSNQVLHLNPSELSHVQYLISLIGKEYDSRADGYKVAAKSYLIAILTLLGRLWERTYQGQMSGYNKKKELVENAILHINKNITNRLLVDELASAVYLSPDYFRRVFRDVTGLSPVKYINGLRMEKAKELLDHTDLSVGKISEAIGIGDAQYFSRLFHESEGMSPMQYKNRKK